MWRSILSRQRCVPLRNFNAASASPLIQVLPLSNFILNPTLSTTPFSSLGFPQISLLSNNPRFFSQQIATQNEDGAVHLENDDVPVQNDDGNENVVGVEEEEQVHQIDDEKLEKVVFFLQNEEVSDDGSFESSLNHMNLNIHQDFLIKAIEKIEIVSVQNLVRFLNWVWSENSREVTAQVLEFFVVTICNSGGSLRDKDVYSLWDLVKEIGEKENGVVNVAILNELVSSFSKLGKGKAALGVLEKFHGFQCVPDAESYYFTIEGLCRRLDFDLACSVCQKMIDAQRIPDGEKIGRMLSWLCKGEKVKEAHAVYMAAMENKIYPPLSSVGFLVGNLCHKNETVQLALELLNDIPAERRKRAIKPFSAVVRALCRIKDVDQAKELVLKMIADGPLPGNAVFNYVITGYSKVGEMGQAVEMLRLLESRGLKPDVYSYSVIASAYSNGGEMEEARKILEEAKKNRSKLSPVMYHTLIRGYCKLERFDEALELLTEMKDFGVRASADEYEKLIQSLCLKALDWEKAEKLQEEMKLEYRYMPPVAKLIEIVNGGSLGHVRMVSIREHRFPFLVKVNNWNRFNVNSGGTLVEKCCHFFDLMRLFVGANPVRVMASGAIDVNHKDEIYDGKVPDIIDNAYVIVEFDNGSRGMLDLCMFAEGSKNEQEISVVGDIGKGEAFVPESVVRLGTREAGRDGVQSVKAEDPRIKYDGLHHGSSYLEHLNFLGAIRGKGEKVPAVDLQDGLISVAIGVAAQLSIENGRFVTIQEVMDGLQV